MARLIDKIEERERQTEAKAPAEKKAPVVVRMTEQTKSSSGKDKQISAKVNSETYAAFTEINRALGMSNNSALNMIIADYVREKRYVLEDIK